MGYKNTDDVFKEMQPILDSCAEKENYIDGIAFVHNFNIQLISDVRNREFDDAVVSGLLDKLSEAITQTFDTDTSLEYACFQIKTTDGKLQAWSIATPFKDKDYKLVFAGILKTDKNLQVHQGTVPSYIKKLLPLIEAYDEITGS